MNERIEANGAPLLLAMGLGGLLALLLVFPDLRAGLGALVAVSAMGVAFINPRPVLFLIPFAIALTPEIRVGVPLRLEDFLMLPLAAGWLARQCVFKDHRRTPFDRLLLGYLAVGFAATIWGGYLGTVNLLGLTKDFGATFHLLKRAEFVLLFLIVCDTLATPRDVQRMIYVLIAAMLGLSAFALLQYLGRAPSIVPADPGHEAGLGSMLVVALALSLLPAAGRTAKLLLVGVILFAVAALPPTLGRNYIATTVVVMLYIGLFYQRWVLLFFPLAWIAGLYLYPPEIVAHVLTLRHVFSLDPTGAATGGASFLSRLAPPTYFGLFGLGHSPVLGFGLASRDLGAFDSEYATQLFYTGLIGLAIFLILGARLFRVTGEVMRAAADPLNAAVARGFHLVWIAYVAHSIFSPSISASRVGAVFFLVAGLLVVLHRSLVQPPEPGEALLARAAQS